MHSLQTLVCRTSCTCHTFACRFSACGNCRCRHKAACLCTHSCLCFGLGCICTSARRWTHTSWSHLSSFLSSNSWQACQGGLARQSEYLQRFNFVGCTDLDRHNVADPLSPNPNFKQLNALLGVTTRSLTDNPDKGSKGKHSVQ